MKTKYLKGIDVDISSSAIDGAILPPPHGQQPKCQKLVVKATNENPYGLGIDFMYVTLEGFGPAFSVPVDPKQNGGLVKHGLKQSATYELRFRIINPHKAFKAAIRVLLNKTINLPYSDYLNLTAQEQSKVAFLFDRVLRSVKAPRVDKFSPQSRMQIHNHYKNKINPRVKETIIRPQKDIKGKLVVKSVRGGLSDGTTFAWDPGDKMVRIVQEGSITKFPPRDPSFDLFGFDLRKKPTAIKRSPMPNAPSSFLSRTVAAARRVFKF